MHLERAQDPSRRKASNSKVKAQQECLRTGRQVLLLG